MELRAGVSGTDLRADTAVAASWVEALCLSVEQVGKGGVQEVGVGAEEKRCTQTETGRNGALAFFNKIRGRVRG